MRKTLTGLVAIGLALALAACGSSDELKGTEPGGWNANRDAKVGIAMPTRTSERWVQDGENMVEQFNAMGYKAELNYADDDVTRQVAQLDAMIEGGSKLLVIGSIDGSALTEVLAKAAAKNIPVIAYDRLIRDTPHVDYYATFDNFRVGVLQGSLLVDRLGLDEGKGPFNVELFAGSPDDSNATSFYEGALETLKPYLDSGKLVVRSGQTSFEDVATLRWDVPTARTRLNKILRANYQDATLNAVLSPFDGMSVGIIEVLKANGYGTAAKPLPVISGQDAELASIKSIIAGEQAGTIFKDTRELAKVAVQMGNALLTDSEPVVNDTKSFNNGVEVVPTYLLQAAAVDKSNYQTLLVDGGYIAPEDLES